jgi:hypothetical protein
MGFEALSMKISVFWNVTSYSIVDRYQCFGVTCCLHLWGREWRQQAPPKRWSLSTRLCGVKSQKTIILTAKYVSEVRNVPAEVGSPGPIRWRVDYTFFPVSK